MISGHTKCWDSTLPHLRAGVLRNDESTKHTKFLVSHLEQGLGNVFLESHLSYKFVRWDER